MVNPEHTEQLGAPILIIILADVAHVRCFVQSKTSYHALCGHILRDTFRTCLGGSYRGWQTVFMVVI